MSGVSVSRFSSMRAAVQLARYGNVLRVSSSRISSNVAAPSQHLQRRLLRVQSAGTNASAKALVDWVEGAGGSADGVVRATASWHCTPVPFRLLACFLVRGRSAALSGLPASLRAACRQANALHKASSLALLKLCRDGYLRPSTDRSASPTLTASTAGPAGDSSPPATPKLARPW